MGAGTTVGEWMATGRLVGVDQARVRELGQVPEQEVVVLTIGDSVARAEIPALCERLRALLEGRACEAVVCDLATLVQADLAAVEALARLQLTARRLGCRVRLRNESGELAALLELTGLSEVLPLESDAPDVKRPLPREPRRQAKEREEPSCVAEEGDSADPTA
jgi:anti-anti-sigma factor